MMPLPIKEESFLIQKLTSLRYLQTMPVDTQNLHVTENKNKSKVNIQVTKANSSPTKNPSKEIQKDTDSIKFHVLKMKMLKNTHMKNMIGVVFRDAIPMLD